MLKLHISQPYWDNKRKRKRIEGVARRLSVGDRVCRVWLQLSDKVRPTEIRAKFKCQVGTQGNWIVRPEHDTDLALWSAKAMLHAIKVLKEVFPRSITF